jgi:hypothetical protein
VQVLLQLPALTEGVTDRPDCCRMSGVAGGSLKLGREVSVDARGMVLLLSCRCDSASGLRYAVVSRLLLLLLASAVSLPPANEAGSVVPAELCCQTARRTTLLASDIMSLLSV